MGSNFSVVKIYISLNDLAVLARNGHRQTNVQGKAIDLPAGP